MATQVQAGWAIGNIENVDTRLGPWNTTDEFTGSIDITRRYLGMTIIVTGSGTTEEYWFKDGITDTDLVLKESSSFSVSASYALTASYVATASYIPTLQEITNVGATTTNDIIISGSIIVLETASINYLHTIYETSSIIYASGSTKFGDTLDDTHVRTGSVDITGSLIVDGISYPTADGENGDVITTDGLGNLSIDKPKIYMQVKNAWSAALPKGTPVYASSSTGNLENVKPASASSADTMPAIGVLANDLDPEEEGLAIVTGFINGVNTSTFNESDVVYVGADGGFTNIKPTGSNLIQNLGIVTKVDVSNGSGFVYGSGRANDVPNISPGYAWVGNSDSVATAVATSSFIVDDAISSSYALSSSYSDFANLAVNSITASSTEKVVLVQVSDDNNYGLVLRDGTAAGAQSLYADSEIDTPAWNPSTNTFTALNISSSIITASIISASNGITGSLYGTSSWAEDAISSSYALTASYAENATSWDGIFTGSAEITGSLGITGSLEITGSTVIEGSGSTLFEIIGSEGQLFSVTDSLTGSLFAVSDVSGLPILEVFSDDTVKIGSFNNQAIIVSGSTSIITGSFTGSLSGSLYGTSSWAEDTISSSYALTASYAENATSWNGIFTGSAEITGSLEVIGGITATSITSSGPISSSNDIFARDVHTSRDVIATGSIITHDMVYLDNGNSIIWDYGGSNESRIRGAAGGKFTFSSGSTIVATISSSGVISEGSLFASLSSDTDDTVVIYKDGELKTDEIDPRVWDNSLVSFNPTPSSTELAVFSNSSSISGYSGLTFNPGLRILTISTSLGEVNLNGSSGEITASGNISSSGDLYINDVYASDYTGNTYAVDGIVFADFDVDKVKLGNQTYHLQFRATGYDFENPITASIISASNGITGSLYGTSSWAVSSSYALTASHALNVFTPTLQQVTDEGASTTIPITASIISASNGITGSLLGTASYSTTTEKLAFNLQDTDVVNYRLYFGTIGTVPNTNYYGSTELSYNPGLNSLILPKVTVTASIVSASGGFIGDLTGTSSWAEDAISASYALTSSYASSSTSASYALTSSYASSSTSASYALTASYVATSSYTPTLQQVITAGNTTNTSIISTAALMLSGSGTISSSNSYTRTLTVDGINSSANAYSLQVKNSNGDYILSTENNGMVGIGVQNPSYPLDIQSRPSTSNYGVRADGFRLNSAGALVSGSTPTEYGTPKQSSFLVKNIDYPVRLYNGFQQLNNNRYYDAIQTNRFHGRSKQIACSVNGGAFQQISSLFDASYEGGYTIATVGNSGSLHLDFSEYGLTGANGFTYPQGQIHLTFYYFNGPSSITASLYYNTGTTSSVNFEPYDYQPGAGNDDFNAWRGTIPSTNYLVGVQFHITASSTNNSQITEIEYHGSRMTYSEAGNISRLGGYIQTLTFSDSGIYFEGSNNDNYETRLIAAEPTADRTITLQDGTGTLAFTSDITVPSLQQVTTVGASTTIPITASIVSASGGFIGDLTGTSSWAEDAISSSYALTASYAENSGPFVLTTLASDSATNVDTFATTTYTGAIYDYILLDTTVGVRAGQFMVAHDNGSITFTDNSTRHLFDSTAPEISAQINGADVEVQVTNGNGYTFKAFVKKL